VQRTEEERQAKGETQRQAKTKESHRATEQTRDESKRPVKTRQATVQQRGIHPRPPWGSALAGHRKTDARTEGKRRRKEKNTRRKGAAAARWEHPWVWVPQGQDKPSPGVLGASRGLDKAQPTHKKITKKERKQGTGENEEPPERTANETRSAAPGQQHAVYRRAARPKETKCMVHKEQVLP